MAQDKRVEVAFPVTMKSGLTVVLIAISILNGCTSKMHQTHQVGPLTDSELRQAMAEAHRDAKLDRKQHQTLGFCIGGGCVYGSGIGISYMMGASVPTHRLAALKGKSDAYIFVYEMEYVKEIKRYRNSAAITGTVVMSTIYVILVALAVNNI